MSNTYFQFKQFTIHQDRCAMKVTTDACLFGAWVAREVVIAGKAKQGSSESGVRSRESSLRTKQSKEVRKILDIGTGTGLLSLMLAQKTNAAIDAIEIEKDAYEQAEENILASPWKDRVTIYHADVREFSFPHKYDIIVSNPPFYENELKSPDQKKNIAHHGSLSLNDLLEIVFYNLDTDGQFYLLLPLKRMTDAGFLLPKYELVVTQSIFIKQSIQHDYFRTFMKGERFSNDEKKYSKNEIAIWNEKKEYTNEFAELLTDYYLYL